MGANPKATFAVFFGTRGFFPSSLIAGARKEMLAVLKKHGYGSLAMDASATPTGAVETAEQGQKFARFLKEHDGEFDGVIICLPNFGDETGAVSALKDAGVPILIQAYPDENDKMAPEVRRDAFCGKFSVMDVFSQYGVPFTALKPHTIVPTAKRFAEQLDYFAAVCRVVRDLREMTVGAVGARTTAFKTVRIDELALQRNGITMETFDLSDIFARMRSVTASASAYKQKADVLKKYSDWTGIPDKAFDQLVRLGVVLDKLMDECALDAMALRCWVEMQQQLGISPCVVMSHMNDLNRIIACEVDVGNAIAMYALSAASGGPAACLDWNNNYGDEEEKCILFHCGPVPQSMMVKRGRVTDHSILANAVGKGCSYGCNVGRIKPTPFTFSSLTTEEGQIKAYIGEGRFTADPIADDFFGCAGVAEIEELQDVLLHIGMEGHRHHTSVTPGHVMEPMREALGYYLGWDIALPQLES